ncbi:MAG: hypothetical protein IT281_10470 [Ignavibacteria bacterium]|nr:hypothetical protein [Ignavibacteria bacterium]
MVVEFIGLFDSNGDGEGKPVAAEEVKLFNDEKFGVGKPNGGNAPNDDIDEKPNGEPQGRSIKYYYAYEEKQQCFSYKKKRKKPYY